MFWTVIASCVENFIVLLCANALDKYRSDTSSFEALIEKQSESIQKIHENLYNLKFEESDIQLYHQGVQKEQTNIKSNLSSFKNDHDTLYERTKTLECDLSDTRKQIIKLTELQDQKDKQGRINNLEIYGLPQTKGKNLNNILFKISSKIGFVLSPAVVDFIHRVRRFTTKSPRGNTSTLEAVSRIFNSKYCRKVHSAQKKE